MKKRIVIILVLVVAILSIYPLKVLITLFKAPAYSEFVPTEECCEIPELYVEICNLMVDSKGFYIVNSDNSDIIRLIKYTRDECLEDSDVSFDGTKDETVWSIDKNRIFNLQYVRVNDRSIEFISNDDSNYKLVYSKSLPSIFIDFYHDNNLDSFRNIKRIETNWYFIYY